MKSDITVELFESTLRTLNEGVRNTDTGQVITSDRKKLKHVDRYANEPIRVAIFKQIDAIIQKAVWLTGTTPDNRNRRKKFPDESRFHALALPVGYEGKNYVAILTIQKDDKGRNLYNLQDLQIETLASLVGNKSTADKGQNRKDSISKVIRDFVERKSELIDPSATFSIGMMEDADGQAMHEARERTPEEIKLAQALKEFREADTKTDAMRRRLRELQVKAVESRKRQRVEQSAMKKLEAEVFILPEITPIYTPICQTFGVISSHNQSRRNPLAKVLKLLIISHLGKKKPLQS